MENIAKAIINVMRDVKGIDKSITVGTGQSSYKGVPDNEVKRIIGESMAKNGLCVIPTGIESREEINRWSEEYNGQKKEKSQVFTAVKTKYLLLHESGESIEISGYGHGVDSQDKSAGKATTYALKYAMLYTFFVPTGKIDDTDLTHSDDIEVPTVNELPWLNEKDSVYKQIVDRIKAGEKDVINKAKAHYKISRDTFAKLTAIEKSI